MKVIFDSRDFSWCDLCGQTVFGNSAQVIEGKGKVSSKRDLRIVHRQCWEETFGANKRPGSGSKV